MAIKLELDQRIINNSNNSIELLGVNILKKYFNETNVKYSTNGCIHEIASIAKEYNISDIQIGELKLDVRVIVDDEFPQLWIPKKHFDLGIYSDIYIGVRVSNDLREADIVGFIETSSIQNTQENRNYYIIDAAKLKPIDKIENIMNSLIPRQKSVASYHHERAKELFIGYIDGELTKDNKDFLIQHFTSCTECVIAFNNFHNFENIAKLCSADNVSRDNNVFDDYTLKLLAGDFPKQDIEVTYEVSDNEIQAASEKVSQMLDKTEIVPEIELVQEDLSIESVEINNDTENVLEIESAIEQTPVQDDLTQLVEDIKTQDEQNILEIIEEKDPEVNTIPEIDELTLEFDDNTVELTDNEVPQESTDNLLDIINQFETPVVEEESTTELIIEEPNNAIQEDITPLTEQQDELEITNNDDNLLELIQEPALLQESEDLLQIEEAEPAQNFEVQELSLEGVAEPTIEFEESEDLLQIEEDEPAQNVEVQELSLEEVAEPTIEFEESEDLLHIEEDEPAQNVEVQELSLEEVAEPTIEFEESEDLLQIEEDEPAQNIEEQELSLEGVAEPTIEFEESEDLLQIEEDEPAQNIEVQELSLEEVAESTIESEESEDLLQIEEDEPTQNVEVQELSLEGVAESTIEFEESEDLLHTEEDEPAQEKNAQPEVELFDLSDIVNEMEVNEPAQKQTSSVPEVEHTDIPEQTQDISAKIPEKYKSVIDHEAMNLLLQDDDGLSGLNNSEIPKEHAPNQEIPELIEEGFVNQDLEPEAQEYALSEEEQRMVQAAAGSCLLKTASIVAVVSCIAVGGVFIAKDPSFLNQAMDKAKNIIAKTTQQQTIPATVKKAEPTPQPTTVEKPIAEKTTLKEPIKDTNKPEKEAVTATPVSKVTTAKPTPVVEMPKAEVAQTPTKVTPVAKSKSINEAMARALTGGHNAVRISKVSWEVGNSIAKDADFKKFLVLAGQSIKLDLSQELLLTNDKVYSDQVKVLLTFQKSGKLSSAIMRKSSGSKQIDTIVLQTINDTMKYLKMPAVETNKRSIEAYIMINL